MNESLDRLKRCYDYWKNSDWTLKHWNAPHIQLTIAIVEELLMDKSQPEEKVFFHAPLSTEQYKPFNEALNNPIKGHLMTETFYKYHYK